MKAQSIIKFEDKVQKFDKVKPGKRLTFDYVFTNIGTQPLVISTIKVACSCTKFEYPNYPVLPNKKDTIHVSFDTKGKYGYQDRILEIYSNAKNNPVKIRFKGVVDKKGG